MCIDIWKSHCPILLWWGHHDKSFILRYIGEMCSCIAEQQQWQQSYSSAGQCTYSFFMTMNVNFPGWCIGWGGLVAWLSPSPDFTTLDSFSLGLWKTSVQPKSEYTGWTQSMDHCNNSCRYYRGYVSVSSKRWTVGGMYAEHTVWSILPLTSCCLCKRIVSVDE